MPETLKLAFKFTLGFGKGAGIGIDLIVTIDFLSDNDDAIPSDVDDFFFRLSFSISSSTSLSQFAFAGAVGTHSRAIYFLCSYLARINDSNAESVCGRRKPSGN